MALSDDQKAILRLLAQRGEQGYEDLSALMGISAEEVYRRAKDAAAALEADGIPAPEIPEPPGGTGSPSVAISKEAPPGEPVPPTVPAEPQEPAPEVVHASEAPRAKPKPPPPALPKGKPKPPLKKELKLLEGRGLWAILAGVAIVVLFVIFIFVGGGDDDSGDGSASSSADSCKVTASVPEPSGKNIEALAVAAVKTGKDVTRAVLNPVDGSDAQGLAVFGRVKDSLALQVAAEGLPPSGECGYTIWLAASPQKMLPLASTDVAKNGAINAQVEVPVEVLAYLANETFGQLAITRTDESQLKASLAEATKEKKAPVYTGTEVLRGSVAGPIVGAAKRLEQQQKEK
ncbi:MAG TPA: AsnC family protein [Solirubrobacterales bacterium]|nr:AsnC family protein [Solirubrobacterales bacterium]